MIPEATQISSFLAERFGQVADVAVLQAGAWSSAYSFRVDGRDLVLRIGSQRGDFDKDVAAATWRQPGLPVPEALEVGEAFDRHYIVTQLHHGTKLADLDPARVPHAIAGLFEVLAAMRHVSLPGTGFGIWHPPDGSGPASTWSDYLCGVVDRDESRLTNWRRKLAAQPQAKAAFESGCVALQNHAPDIAAARQLVHADLLLNHLVGPDNRVTAVFDWGNALAGDPLYDIAWIVYCIPWFPTVDRGQVLRLARQHFPADDIERLIPLYELHIAVASLQYMAFADDLSGMKISRGRIAQLLATLAGT